MKEVEVVVREKQAEAVDSAVLAPAGRPAVRSAPGQHGTRAAGHHVIESGGGGNAERPEEGDHGHGAGRGDHAVTR